MDPEALFWNDPMTKLKNHAMAMGYRLIDLFKQFDADNSWTVTKEEFVQGVQVRPYVKPGLQLVSIK